MLFSSSFGETKRLKIKKKWYEYNNKKQVIVVFK